MKLNSVVFRTKNIAGLRKFYEGVLQIQVGKYCPPGGVQRDDCSDKYVNYYFDQVLLGFEFSDGDIDLATIVFSSCDMGEIRTWLSSQAIPFTQHSLSHGGAFLKAVDPEGRQLIFE